MPTEDHEEGRGVTYVFRNKECKKRFTNRNDGLKARVLVVYRATPVLKHMFTCALRQSGAIVAVTGEGLSDARAISEANVGFAMGEDGCAAAKDHADVILTDDNFMSVVNAIRWGRNIQDNVRKFVTFQMTVNISCCVFVITMAVFLGHSPFNIVQLLWINLIMDVLAAIAFSTEAPHPTDIRKERIKNSQKIITQLMTRNIMFQVVYQLVVMYLIMFVGPMVGGYQYNLFTTEMTNENGTPSFRKLHQTYMFQCFVFMNLFNMVNCRVLGSIAAPAELDDSVAAVADTTDGKEYNIFAGIHRNWWFLIVLFAEFNVQYFMVGYVGLGYLFNTTPMTVGMHFTALGLGLGSWAVQAIAKATPDKLVHRMPIFGEDEDTLNAVNSAAEGYTQRLSIKAAGEGTPDGDEEREHDQLDNGFGVNR